MKKDFSSLARRIERRKSEGRKRRRTLKSLVGQSTYDTQEGVMTNDHPSIVSLQ
ncbi:hypothetical protein CSUI_004922 [Cystoisospora suis]|uniref:Uncharacterized protein n=1 Tax=Cystoisospora suis TaxID=483139 RepID=A0A2C6KZ77_9APIC|nr:hypothetical protein CSUI_004922 [Cystoisospora suis]